MKRPQYEPIIFKYRFSQDTVRVWRSGWGGDQFEVITPDEFDELKKMMRRFSIVMLEEVD